MVPGSTSAIFQQCDIALMHLSITVRPRAAPSGAAPPNHHMSRASQQQCVCRHKYEATEH